MDILNKMILTACLCGIAVSICDMVSPSEKFSKQIHFILSLVFAIGILTPVIGIVQKFSDDSSVMSMESYDFQSENEVVYDKYLKQITEDNIENSLRMLLENNNITVDKICVEIDISDNSCIFINNIGLSCNDFEKASEIINSEVGRECGVWNME